jgi:predicted dehydrogenase
VNKKKIKLAILGVGRWGVNFVRNFLAHPETQIVAIVDPDSKHLQECQEKFSLSNSEIIFAAAWQDIRTSLELDAIVVVTPASTHYPLIADALNLGYHVLSEKPLTLEARESLELGDLAARQGKILLVDHTYLFHGVVLKGQEFLTSANLGKKLYGYATRTHLGPVRQDVDALWDLAIHDIAIFNTWLQETPQEVRAVATNWLQPHLADLVWLTLIYPSGFQAFIHLCWCNPDKQRRLCVVTETGTLIFDEMSANSPLVWQKGHFTKVAQTFLPTGQETVIIPVEKTEPLKNVCNSFVQAIQTQTPVEFSSGWVGTELVNILQALSKSLHQQGQLVSVPHL